MNSLLAVKLHEYWRKKILKYNHSHYRLTWLWIIYIYIYMWHYTLDNLKDKRRLYVYSKIEALYHSTMINNSTVCHWGLRSSVGDLYYDFIPKLSSSLRKLLYFISNTCFNFWPLTIPFYPIFYAFLYSLELRIYWLYPLQRSKTPPQGMALIWY